MAKKRVKQSQNKKSVKKNRKWKRMKSAARPKAKATKAATGRYREATPLPHAVGKRPKDLAWLTSSKIKTIRADLVRMRDDILRTVRKQVVDEVDNGDSVDQAGQSIEKELMFELSDNERTTLDMIEAAIRKIDNGTYGLCEATQKPITRARLQAIPYARYSIAYQNQLEQKVTETAEPGFDFSVIGDLDRAGDA